MAVDPDLAVSHDAVEFDKDAPIGVIRGKGEMFPVPADAGWKKAAGAARGILLVELAFDAPVVRHVQGAPRGVREAGLFGAWSVGFEEAPIGVEGNGSPDEPLYRSRRQQKWNQPRNNTHREAPLEVLGSRSLD